MIGNIRRVFTMFWFSTNCKVLCDSRTPFFKNYKPRIQKFFLFFHQSFHLNLLRCRCRNTKIFWPQQMRWQSSTNSYINKTLERLVTKLRHREICIRLRDKGCTLVFSRQKEVSVGSNEVVSSQSYLHCKLNGKRVSDQRWKCSNSHGRFQ